MAVDITRWQESRSLQVAALTRSIAEDAVELIDVVWDPLPAVSAGKDALAAGSSIVHSGDANNVAFEATAVGGDEVVSSNIEVSAEFSFGRHTGVTLETRAAIADWNPVMKL